MKKILRSIALGTVLVASCASYVAAQTTDRSQFAYALQQEAGARHNRYTISFNASGAAKSAVLVLTNTETGEVVNVTLGAVTKGENTFTLNLSETAMEHTGTFTWAIELHNYSIPKDIVTTAINVGGGRAGVVCMVDPTLDSYGYTVIGRTQNTGFDIYDPQGNKIKSAIHSKNAVMGGTSANASCPMRGVQRENTAQFACWGDAAYGVVALDLTGINQNVTPAAPYSVFLGTKASNGAVTYNGNKVGSGTPCVAYAGEGEGTILFTFDEDIFKNNLAANPIGTAMTTGKAAVNWGFGGKMANQNVGLVGTKTGVFFSQTRGLGNSMGDVPGLGYIDIESKSMIWSCKDEAETNPNFLTSSSGGVDINPAGDLLAVTTVSGINIYHLSWDGNKPVLTPYKTIASQYQREIYTALKFDAGNNLHIINQTTGYYQVILANDESVITTPALAGSEIVLEEPTADDFPGHMYLVGAATGWTEPSAANAELYANYTLDETEVDTKIYTGKFYMPGNTANYFRLFAGLDGWGSTSYGPSADNGNFAITFTDGTYEGPLYATNEGNFNVSALPVGGAGYYDFTVDLNTNTIKIDYTFSYTPPTLYVRGDFNDWGTLAMEMAGPEEVDGQYVYTYTASLENASGAFKIADADYNIEFGSQFPFANGVAANVWSDNKNNMTLPDGKYMTLHFVYNPMSVTSQLTIDWLESAELSRFAYDINYEQLFNDATGKHYGVVTYKASGDAAHAYLIATPVVATYALTAADDAEDGTITVDMGEAQAGENTYELDLDQFSYEHKYSFAIQLENNHEGLGAPVVVTRKTFTSGWGRGGVVAITDPAYDSYGYVVMATSLNGGLLVADPTGDIKPYTNPTFNLATAVNTVPLRGGEHLGMAMFASLYPDLKGIYAVDPLNPTAEADQIVDGPALFNSTCVSFVGEGDETMMWIYDKDNSGLKAYPIGTSAVVTENASIICTSANTGWGSTGTLANNNVCVAPASNGFFAAQTRGNGMEAGTPAFVYCDKDGKLITRSLPLFQEAGFTMPSSNGAIALNSDETILAVGTYTGMEFFSVEWNDNKPALTHLWTVSLSSSTANFGQAVFDAADNLYVVGGNTGATNATGYYAVITMPGTVKATTPAKALEQNLIVSGVENVSADAAVEYEPVYYTLGGVKVAADQLTPGIYVKVVGPTATKVVVK